MKRTAYALMGALSVSLMWSVSALALEDPVETFFKGCEKEITSYCKDVTPGEGRLLACLYAHEDKVSARCEYAIYDAAAQLERVVTAITYVANECRDDLKAHCSSVEPGEGRLLDCIEKNQAKVSGRCKQAISDVGMHNK
jgi:hypothetical protein